MTQHVLAFAGPANGWGLFGALVIGLIFAGMIGEIAGRRAAERERRSQPDAKAAPPTPND
jgi:hypothetical protein